MIHRPVTALLTVLTALAGIPTAVRLVGDHGRILFALLTVVLPFALVPLVVLLVIEVVLRRKKLAVASAALLVLNAVWIAPLYIGSSVPKGTALNVMQANLRYGLADPFRLTAIVKEQHVDVLAAEELTQQAIDNLRGAGLDRVLPYSTLLPGHGPDGGGLWSRYPITPQEAWNTRFMSPGALVKAPGQPVLVRVIHAYPPVGDEKGVYKADYDKVVGHVKALPTTDPTILMGDFNATLDNSLLRDIEGSRFRDAGEKAGSGMLRTWGVHPGQVTLLDLDHVFVDKRIGAKSTQVVDLPGSDHDGLIARLVVQAP